MDTPYLSKIHFQTLPETESDEVEAILRRQIEQENSERYRFAYSDTDLIDSNSHGDSLVISQVIEELQYGHRACL